MQRAANSKLVVGLLGLALCLALTGCAVRVDKTWANLPKSEKPKTDPTIARLRGEAEANPNSAKAYAALADAYLARGNAEKATEAALRLLELDPENDQAMRLLLNLSQQSQQLAIRIAQFCNNVAKDKPGQSRALNIVGVFLLRGRDLDRAVQVLRQAAEADPSFAHPAANLAVCYAMQGDDAKSADWRAKAVRLAPSDPTISLVLAGVYANRGQGDKALTEYERASSLAPDSPQIYLEIGRTNLRTGAPDKAEAAFRRALELQPKFVQARMALGGLLASQGRTQEALAQFQTATQQSPNLVEAHVAAGLLQYASGNSAAAEQELTKALEIKPDSADAANGLAYMYANRGEKLDTALDLAERAMALKSSDPGVGDTYGWVLVKAGRTQEGIDKLAWAAAKAPDTPTVMYHLGAAYYQANDRARAEQWLRRALSSSGRFAAPEDKAEAEKLLATVRKQ